MSGLHLMGSRGIRVIIVGGRDFTPTQQNLDTLEWLHDELGFTEVISGHASILCSLAPHNGELSTPWLKGAAPTAA